MGNLADTIIRHLEPLIGLRLAVARRAADMRVLHFGQMCDVDGGTVGDYAMHIQCPWRLEGPTGIVTGRSDLWEPIQPMGDGSRATWTYESGNLQDLRMQAFLGGRDATTGSAANLGSLLVVESVAADDYGGAELRMSGGYRLVVFPAGIHGEDWRVFRPTRDDPHFVISGGKVETD